MIEVKWDEKKCASPQDCRECLDICPQGVFTIHPRDGRKPGIVTADWAITAVFLSLCTACEICEEVCPQDAIAVSVVQ
jgi:NAD-dependent dihydropyrimidine dehydrogenase PreA subunit